MSYPIEYGGELNSPYSVKYSEFYSPPNHSKYPELQLNPGQHDLDYLLMLPLDTPNTIPTPATNFKQQKDLNSSLQMHSKSSSNAEQNCLPTEDNFGLNSLLEFPTPANKEQAYFTGDMSWELMGTLEQSVLNDMDFINYPEANLPDEIHFWHDLQKDASYQNGIVHEPKVDPNSFVSSPTMEQHTSPQQHTPTPMDQSNTMYSDILPDVSHLGQPVEVSPMDVVPLLSEEIHNETTSSGPENLEHHLQTLFENTFDISDLTMGIPPEKGITTLNHTPHGENQQLPPQHALSKNRPSHKRQTNEQSEVSKPKPPLLFGKHEREIIHKLLPLKQGGRSKPLTRDKLIIMPVEDFNTLLEQAQLSEIEVAFMKEWRRRGKNKAAAQTARKRKREEVVDLDQEVDNMRQQKTALEKRCDELQSLVASLNARSKAAEEKLYKRQTAITGLPVSKDTHHILITDDDELLLIPRTNSKIAVAN